MESIIAEILANAAFRAIIEDVAIEVVSRLLHRRATDPNFLAQSDTAFSALASARTPEELTNAQSNLRVLLAR